MSGRKLDFHSTMFSVETARIDWRHMVDLIDPACVEQCLGIKKYCLLGFFLCIKVFFYVSINAIKLLSYVAYQFTGYYCKTLVGVSIF